MVFNSAIPLCLVIYIILCCLLMYLQPEFIFNNQGKFKQFGTTNQINNKTICPVWLMIMLIGCFSYVISLVLTNYKSTSNN
jgi:hypothetical protein